MKEEDKQEFTKALKAFLFTIDGTHSPDGLVLAHYWEALEKHELSKVLKALNDLAVISSEHVKPAEVVSKITGKKLVKAKDEFDYLLTVLRKDGRRRLKDGELSEKGMKAYLAIGAWSALNVPASQQGYARSMFYQEYDK